MKDNKVNLTNDNKKIKNISIPTNEKDIKLVKNSKNINTSENDKNDLYILTTPQKNIWSMEKYYNKTSLNNVCGSVVIHEVIDFDKLKTAVDVLVRMNDAFGIQFITDGDTIRQFYDKNIVDNFDTKIVEVSDESELNDLEQKLSHIVFDDNYLFELKVFKLPTNEGGVICAIHHSLSDSWSIGLISKYITEIYYDLLQLKSIPTDLNEFANEEREKFKIASYFDFVKREDSYLNSSSFEKDKKFWNGVFETVPELPQFAPINMGNSDVASSKKCKNSSDVVTHSKSENSTDKLNLMNGHSSTNELSPNSPKAFRECFELSSTIMDKIKKFCSENKTSVFNFLMSMYSLYISAVSNSKDFVIGTPVLNRSTVTEKNTLGMFVSTMPLHINVDYELSFKDFCKGISSNTFSAFRHQHYPYESILSDLRKKYNNIPNLYNLIVSYQLTKTVSDKVDCETHWNFNGYSPDDMQIHIVDYNDTGALSILYDYKDSKFKLTDIKDLHCRILSMIDTVLNNPEICIRDIDVVTPDEKNEILNVFNDTSYDYDKNKTFAILFEEQVSRTPNDIALVFEGEKLTYKELNEKANSLACYLRNAGVTRNDIVGIMVNRSLEVIIAILGVLKSGAAYIPIDPRFPKDRINYMLENSNAKLLLTQKSLENSVSFKKTILVDLGNNKIYNLSTNNLEHSNLPSDLAYVVFTSGSTGNPKGVMVKNGSLTNFINYCNEHIEFLKNPSNIGLATITTISFDMFVLDLIVLQRGLKLVMSNGDEQNTPQLLNDLIEKNDVEIMQTTPSRLQIFINNINTIPAIKKLKFVELGGEGLPLNLLKTLHSFGATVYNCYGPTETTVYSTITKMVDDYINVGKPLYNTQICFLNDNLQLLPKGFPGELCISGDGVSNGYINNKALTDKSFMSSPYYTNKMMYKTGDVGYYTRNGDIICLGRSDYQIKIRGQRIELGEIEEQILSLPFIKSCVVIKKIDSNSHEFLCAYFTANTDVESDTEQIRKHLVKHLASYMVPSYYVQMDSLPYTPNGKIDRKALPEPKNIARDKIIPARNEIDSKLIKLFKDLLNIDVVSIDDSFFDIGGDSLLAINLCARVQSQFNTQLLVSDILSNPRICDLSDIIANSIDSANKCIISKIKKSDFYNTSTAQKRMYFASLMAGNSTIYNIPGCIILDCAINGKKLEKCFNKLIDRHETLRTYFEMENENVVQKILPSVDFKLDIEKNKNNVENKILESIFDSFEKPFDLSVAPLFRAKLVNFNDGKSALFLDAHHIVCDGSSIAIFIDEICKLYNDESVPELDISYKDYACFENERLNSGELNEAENYWINKFSGEIPVLNMPTTSIRPTVQSYKGDKVYASVNNETISKIDVLSKKLGVTPYILMLSAYYIMLSKYTHQNDIIIGSPVASRDIASTHNLIGMFVNTLALRANIDDNLTCKDFILSIKNTIFDSLKYQSYPFDELVNKLNLKKDTSRNPLFDVMFTFQNYGFREFDFNGISSRYYFPNNHISKFDLSLEVLPIRNEMMLTFEYATSLFTKDFITNLSNHYLNILNFILDNIDTKLSNICILSDDEKNNVLVNFNDTFVKYPKEKTLAVLFEEQASRTPNDIALVFEDKELTYKELNEKSNSLACYLRNAGITRNDIVGIMCSRSLEMIISILAVLKSGASYTPIDPTYPEDRINYMLDTIDAKVLLTQRKLENKVDFDNKLFVDLDNKTIYSLNNKNLGNINEPDDLSYVIFTSGSTGRPKGVMLTQKALSNLANYCNSYIDYLKKPSNIAVVSTTTVSFDIFIFETLISLQRGLKLIIANEDEQNTPSLLNKLINKHDVKVIQATPSRMQIFIQNIDSFPALKNLEYVTLAGEQLPQSIVSTLNGFGATVYNGYGPSETTVFSTLTKMTGKSVTIGKPLYNTQIYILDDNLNVVPVGVTGEIYIAGDGVGKGYIKNEDLTKKAFINNPFIPNSIMYKTGDLGTYKSDGTIICLGRADHQIKIRGQRIELGEIEEQILNLPFVKACVVVKRKDENSHEFLCAYYTIKGSTDDNNISSIRKHLVNHLPKYMIPQYFMEMESLPYTPNGKVDRKALPEPKYTHSNDDIIAPRNEIDSRLLQLFEKVLHIDTISISDSFFDLGGDSLSAINLSSQIQSEFGANIYVRDILENPTIQNISDLISRRAGINNMPVIKPVESAEFYKVSSAQRRIYFASQVDKNSIAYNVSGSIIFDGKVDFDKLNNAFKVIIKRHEPLRTSFELHDGDVVQKIKDDIDFNLDVSNNVDFKELNAIFSEFVKPFDLASAPLFNAKLINFINGKSALFINSHHIICDGTSISIFVDELCNLYNGSTLDELSITYKDFACFESEELTSGKFADAEKYWINKFKDEIPVLNMPTVYARPVSQSFDGKKVYASIDVNTVNKINALAKELGVTPYMIMLATYYILLSKYSSQDDIVVGSPIASRDFASTHNLIGMFVNTLALRERIESTLSFKSFVLALKDDLLNAYKYQSYPFDELVNKLDIKKDLSRNPLFDVMFIYQNNGFKNVSFDGISSTYNIPDTGVSKFDLTLEAIPENGKITLNFEYCTKLFNKEFIQNLCNHYLGILNCVLDDYEKRISTIPLLSVDEEKNLYDSVNNTFLKYPKDKHIIDLFEEQVTKTPDDIALVFEDTSYTYKELEHKVNCLANYIRKLPIFKEIIKNDIRAIGIMMNRRAEILISMLAILKTGCAYLPIDPTYPEDRVSYIIDNSGIKLVLTEKALDNKFDVDTIYVDDENNYSNYETFETFYDGDELAYLIYTSGSTGRPKGVMIKDSNVVNFIHAIRKLLPLKNKTIVSITTMCFDIFVAESLLSVCSGVKIIFANNDEQNSPILLNKLCLKHKVNILQTTPSKFNFLISDESNLDYIKNMKLILLSGEAFPHNMLNKIKKITSSRIFNMYGPTETTVWSTYKELTEEKEITIGKPVGNTQVYILDNDLNILPKYVPGKLYIGGDGVTNGYLNRSELTSEKFIDYNGTVIYDTGDLAKINSNNEIECLGRTDFQVKIRGLRIELGEIEKQIANYKGVTDAVVVVKNINDRDVLCGYFVSSGRVTTSLLRNKLAKKLPNYMIPTYLVQLQKFEHTPNGKIDRNKLPTPEIIPKEIVNPKNALQRRILLIWKNILSIDEISIDDNFFEIGGDSLCALRLQLELMKININVNYGDIFKYNTIESLGLFIENMQNSEPSKPIYHKINFLKANLALWRNNDKFKLKLSQKEIKNVLLVGATGFLGIHVLAELLKIDNIKIYCLIRNDPSTSAENKLKNKFKYYFGSDLSNLFGNRIIVIPGEITDKYFGISENTYKTLASSVYTVVNCAALVKHFGNYEDFEKANVTGVKNIVTFCEKYGKTLFHASTVSVSGSSLMSLSSAFNPSKMIYFSENKLFINQALDNVYVRSKFEAEKFLLEELANKKLKGIILRIGNVTNRFIDGKFQENANENAFNNRLKAFIYLKMIPKSIYDGYVEFTPVDILAKSIIHTMKFYTPPMSVLHLYNSKHLYIKNFIKIADELGIKINVVDDDIFKDNLKNILFNSSNYDKVSPLLNDIDNDFNLLYKSNLLVTNKFSLKFLDLAGFDWPEITKEYIKKVIENL